MRKLLCWLGLHSWGLVEQYHSNLHQSPAGEFFYFTRSELRCRHCWRLKIKVERAKK